MIGFYLKSVVIWMIIIECTFLLFKDAIGKRVGTNDTKKAGLIKQLRGLFVLAAIPIIRLIIVVALVYIATCKKEDFDEMMKKVNKE